MNIENFIARRTERSAEGGKPTIMMRVARLAVALSIGVMVITLAVIFGFKAEIWGRLTGVASHAVVCDVQGLDPSRPRAIAATEPLYGLIESLDATERISPFVQRAGVIKGSEGVEGILLKGVDSLFNAPFFESCLVSGELPHFGTATRAMLLSESLATSLKLEVGDRVEILLSAEDGKLQRQLFKLGATYSTGMQESDRLLALVDIAHLRRTNGWSANEVSGLDIWFKDGDAADKFASDFNFASLYTAEGIDERVGAISISQLHPALFGWLSAHDMNGVVVIVIMFVVAAFNMITALLILVLERREMILTLRALGMSIGSVQRIFIYRAAYLLLGALTWGNGVALALCLVQQRWGIMKLDSAGYLLSQVPISLSAWWIVALNLGVVATILLVMILPTRLVARIKASK